MVKMTDVSKLKQYLSTYQNPDAARKDVVNVLQQYKSLMFAQENFVFNNGTSSELVNLHGTIPVHYKGSVYNIPICIWLMNTHPQHAPLCFVKPTQDMSIKVSRNVDHNGRIYLPYLHEWTAPDYTLLGLVRTLCTIFGQTPPVFSKPKTDTATPYPTTSYIPQPGGNYPPYPMGSPYTTPYPMPGYPQAGLPYPTMPQQHYPTPYPPQDHAGMPQTTPYPPATDVSSGGTITEEHIKASLLSALEDKLRRRYREQISQNQAELDTLRRTQQELGDGKKKLDEIIERLRREETEIDRNIGVLEEKLQELESSIAKLSEQDEVEVDEAVITTTPLYNQLLKAFAEEATAEDTIYYFGEALRASAIDVETFLKQVRATSRKQFTLRALMQKCRQKAGLY